jgi:simple sugar transport system substrate-binding protein
MSARGRATRLRGPQSYPSYNLEKIAMKKLLMGAAGATLAVAALAIAATSHTASAADKLKVGFIYLGPIGDLGWTYRHEIGRQEMVKALGDKVETTFLENVNEGPDSERSIEQLARTGHTLIFTTSFGYMDPTLKVAKKYPKIMFEHATGFKSAPNMGTYSGRFYEGRYIQGVIAGKMSKSGTLGYIASFPIPEVISGINATILGAQTTNPNIKLKVIADQGADVIMQHTDSPAAMQVAAQRGILAFGQDSDMIKFGPKTQLTSIIDNWGPYYTRQAKAVLDGTWKTGDTWDGLKEKMVVMAPYTNMPADVKALAEKTEAAIVAGTLHPFKCPVLGQDGKPVDCKGANLEPGQILGMNFYVKGVDDKIPGK